MRRNFNEDDFQDEYDDDDLEGEFIHYIGKDDLLNSIQDMEMFEMNFNAKVLNMAISVAEKSWFWRFKSIKRKTAIIKKSYDLLNRMLTPLEYIESTDDYVDNSGDVDNDDSDDDEMEISE